MLDAGHIPPAGFWTTPAGARFADIDGPILMAPRPAVTTWWINISTGCFTATIPTARFSAFTPDRPSATPGARHCDLRQQPGLELRM